MSPFFLPRRLIGVLLLSLGLAVAGPTANLGMAFSQDAGDAALVDLDDVDSVIADAPPPAQTSDAPGGIDLLSLIWRGGWFMIPIGLMSLLVVALAIERFLALRRRKLLPAALIEHLRGLATPIDRFSPTAALRVCGENPSAAGRVVRAMLMRTGRPLAEVETAASDALQREVDRYSSPIRWLTLAAAATPLMGLLGTVWGMIVAFHESTTLTADRSRSEQLSEGIYTALVTTLAGLIVAIPAAMLALYLENRLVKMFHRVEEIAFAIAPGLERFAGKQRLEPDGSLVPLEASPLPPPPVPASGGSNHGPAGGKAAASMAGRSV